MTTCVLPYHGGKTRIAAKVAAVLDKSKCEHYCEPFAGGLAVLFACRSRKIETINDKTDAVIAFWDTLANDPAAFYNLAEARAVHSETLYVKSREIIRGNLEPETRAELAWALWYCSCVSFGHKIGAGYGYVIAANTGVAGLAPRIQRLMDQSRRVQQLQIFNRCALELIGTVNSPDVLLYCDPPYIGTSFSKAYSEFTPDNLLTLCNLLREHKGEWALSGYEHPHLTKLAQEFRVVEIETAGVFAHTKDTGGKNKQITEQLVTNINKGAQQLAL